MTSAVPSLMRLSARSTVRWRSGSAPREVADGGGVGGGEGGAHHERHGPRHPEPAPTPATAKAVANTSSVPLSTMTRT